MRHSPRNELILGLDIIVSQREKLTPNPSAGVGGGGTECGWRHRRWLLGGLSTVILAALIYCAMNSIGFTESECVVVITSRSSSTRSRDFNAEAALFLVDPVNLGR